MLAERMEVKLIVAIMIMLFAATPMSLAADDNEEMYRAFAVNMSNIGMGGATTIDFHIKRWSTAEEREMLHQILVDKGHDDFIDALRDQEETGWARASGRAARRNPFPSTRLHYAWQYMDEKGHRHVTLVTDRPIGFREAASTSRSVDYDVSMVTLEFPPAANDKVEGTGQLYMALEVSRDEKTKKIIIESAASEPIRLTKVVREE